MNKRTLWITRTAIFIAILVAMQYLTAGLGNQFLTGSLVNLILIVSVMTCGFASGAAVSLVSPFMAFLLGIGTSLVQLVPFIALGNLTIVLVWQLIAAGKEGPVPMIIALVAGAVAKFGVLYLGIVKLAVPLLLKLPAESPGAVAMSLNFSWPQLVTACVGGIIAIFIVPVLRKALNKN